MLIFSLNFSLADESGLRKTVRREQDKNLLLLDTIFKNDLKKVSELLKNGANPHYLTKATWFYIAGKRRLGMQNSSGGFFPTKEKYNFKNNKEYELYSAAIFKKYTKHSKQQVTSKVIQAMDELFETKESLRGKLVILLHQGKTPVEFAIQLKHGQIARLLIDQRGKNDGKIVDEAVFSAIKKNDLATMRELLKSKINLNFTISSKSPLSLATKRNYLGMVELLLKNGADLLYPLGNDRFNFTVFNIAMQYGLVEMLELFLKYAPLSKLWTKKIPIITWVIQNNPLDSFYAKKYLKIKQDNRVEIIKILIKKGAQINFPKIEDSPLIKAITHSRVNELLKIIYFLIEQGAKINHILHLHGPDFSTNRMVTLLGLVDNLRRRYPKNSDSYAKIASKLRAKGGKEKTPLQQERDEARKLLTENNNKKYNKKLGFQYSQRFKYFDGKTGEPQCYIYLHRRQVTKDFKNFKILNKFYSKDSRQVFFNGRPIKGATADRITVLSKMFYARDDHSLYAYGKKLNGANPQQYEFLSDGHLISNGNIYYEDKQIQGADTQTFQVLKFPFSKDKNFVYRNAERFKNANSKTFVAP